MTTRRRRSAERVTLSDVARSAGCSLMSASRALSQPDLVSDALRERVEQAVKALGYVPHPAARSLASSRSNLVAVIIPSLSNAVFVDTVEAIQRVLMPAGYEMMIGVSHYRPEEDERLLRAYLAHQPAGLLLTGFERSDAARAVLANYTAPMVTLMELSERPDDYCVGFSQLEAGVAMTRTLLERGYRHVAFAAAQLDPRTLHRVDLRVLRQQPIQQLCAKTDGRQLRRQQLQCWLIASGLAHGLAIAFGALQGPWIELRRGEGDVTIATLEQRAGHGHAGFQLRETDAVVVRPLAQLHQSDHRCGVVGQHRTRGVAALEPGKQQPGRLVRQVGAQQSLVFFGAIVADADHHFVARRHQHALDGLDRVDEHRVGQRRDDHRDQIGARTGQAARRGMRHVAERLDRLLDTLTQCIGNEIRLRQRARGRHQRAAGTACDIREGYPLGRAASACGHARSIGRKRRILAAGIPGAPPKVRPFPLRPAPGRTAPGRPHRSPSGSPAAPSRACAGSHRH